MDPFKTLTGGSRFDHTRFSNDIAQFDPQASAAAGSSKGSNTALPTALDFFGSAAGAVEGSKKKKDKKNKKRSREDSDEVAPIDYALLLRQHRIKLTGIDPPNPITSFAALSSRFPEQQESIKLLEKNWRGDMQLGEPTGVQMTAWSIMLSDRDALVCAPTGSGKTLAFVLPLLVAHPPLSSLSSSSSSSSSSASSSKVPRPTSLILEPTRELAMQVWREVNSLGKKGGWECVVLGEEERVRKVKRGELSGKGKSKEAEKRKKRRSKKEIKEGEKDAEVEGEGEEEEETDLSMTDILITTPLRLIYAIQSKTVDLSAVRHLILDESDKLFELNFIEQTDEIIAACSNAQGVRKGMFSATMSSTVEEIAKGVMSGGGTGMIRAIVGQKDSATATIDQSLQFVGTEEHKLLALRTLITAGSFTPPVLIFVQSILRSKELAAELLFDKINADCIHADRTAEERDAVVEGFESGKIWCLICTDVMGRGVDFKGVKLVVNYDFPQSGGSYIHRIGRTGRAGKAGKAITFFTKEDAPYLKSIVNVMRSSGCEVPAFMLDLPTPSQRAKKNLSIKPLNRVDVRQTNGAGAVKVGGTRKSGRERVMGGNNSKKGKEVEEKQDVLEKKGPEGTKVGGRRKSGKRELRIRILHLMSDMDS